MHRDQLPSSLVSAGTASGTVSDIAPAVGALSSAQTGDLRKQLQTDPQLDDFEREKAIARIAALVEYLHSLARFHESLWRRDGCFHHKAAFDVAYADCHAARGIMERLILGRSAAQIARMEAERGLDRPACANEERAR